VRTLLLSSSVRKSASWRSRSAVCRRSASPSARSAAAVSAAAASARAARSCAHTQELWESHIPRPAEHRLSQDLSKTLKYLPIDLHVSSPTLQTVITGCTPTLHVHAESLNAREAPTHLNRLRAGGLQLALHVGQLLPRARLASARLHRVARVVAERGQHLHKQPQVVRAALSDAHMAVRDAMYSC